MELIKNSIKIIILMFVFAQQGFSCRLEFTLFGYSLYWLGGFFIISGVHLLFLEGVAALAYNILTKEKVKKEKFNKSLKLAAIVTIILTLFGIFLLWLIYANIIPYEYLFEKQGTGLIYDDKTGRYIEGEPFC